MNAINGDATISIVNQINRGGELMPFLRHLTLEDKERLLAIGLGFHVEVVISTENAECKLYGMEIFNFLKSKRFDLQLESYQFGISPQNQRFDIIPQEGSVIQVYVPVREQIERH